MRRPQKAPYKLCIHTSDYTGNFERELVGYCLGVLDERTEEDLSQYDKDDYCKHWFYQDVMKRDERLYYLHLSQKFKEETGFDDLLSNNEHPLMAEYLLETYRDVDDWEQMTFYYIDKYFKDKEYDCNSLYIQLDKPLNDIWEEIVITRIFKFFRDIRIRGEGCLQFADWNERKCISVELIDENDNILKEYKAEDYPDIYFLKDYFTLTSIFNK